MQKIKSRITPVKKKTKKKQKKNSICQYSYYSKKLGFLIFQSKYQLLYLVMRMTLEEL